MKVVFFEDVEGTAHVGDVKEVKNGFARNYLLPRNVAGPATKDNLQRANSLAQKEARRQEKLDAEARKVSDRLVNYSVTIEAKVGETGRLFGSVTNRDIAEQINASNGLAIDPHIILLPEPIRELGQRPVTIRFTRNVSAEITVEVVPDEASKPVVAKFLAEQAEREKAEREQLARQAAARAPENTASLVEQAVAKEAESQKA